jgi:hypothetical protein
LTLASLRVAGRCGRKGSPTAPLKRLIHKLDWLDTSITDAAKANDHSCAFMANRPGITPNGAKVSDKLLRTAVGHLALSVVVDAVRPPEEPIPEPLVRNIGLHAVVWGGGYHPGKWLLKWGAPEHALVAAIRQFGMAEGRLSIDVEAVRTSTYYRRGTCKTASAAGIF